MTLTNEMKYREQWLQAAVDEFRPWLRDLKAPVPKKVFVSCGFPKGRHGAGRAIGQCWSPQATVDGTMQMFICPTLDQPIDVLATLLHECVHAGCGLECGHKKEFRRVAIELGLAGKMTATYAEEGSKLHGELTLVGERLGPYPHSGMILVKKAKKESRWIRLKSASIEGYTLVISKDSIEEHGWPQDPLGEDMIPKSEEWEPGD